MKQRIMDMAEEEGTSGMHSDFNEKELEVCEILLNLPELIAESESIAVKKQEESVLRERKERPQPFTVVWGAKKILVGNVRRNSSTTCATGRIPAIMATPIQQVKAQQATSPDTPLNFSPSSESDDNSSFPSQHRRKRAELMDTVEDLSKRRELLRKEVEAVTNYHNKLLAFNKKLKEKKQMVVAGSAACSSHEAEEKSNLEIKNNFIFNSGGRSGQPLPYQTAVVPRFPKEHQGQFMVKPVAVESYPQPQRKLQYQSPNAVVGQVRPAMLASSAVLGGANQVSPPCVVDSNNGVDIHTEEMVGLTPSQSLEYAHARGGDSRVQRAAAARRYRKMMMNQQKREIKLKLHSKCGSGTGPTTMPAIKRS